MKILAIGAHQDDNEFLIGGMTAKWVRAGHEVRFLSLCNGCGGHHILTPEETSKTRAGESAAVAKYLGIQYDIWDIDDCTLVADLETRNRLICYIREFSPDLIISHRTNDYHADHRAAGQLVQDASYILTVPHTCPDAPAMRFMPVIIYTEDKFRNPEFDPTYVMSVDDELETKLHIASLNVSQVYEWLPYTHGDTVPEGEAERYAWLRGMPITEDTTDEEILATKTYAYGVRFAKTAARFRKRLIELYGLERGSKIRYAEAFELCPYGGQPTEEFNKALFNF